MGYMEQLKKNIIKNVVSFVCFIIKIQFTKEKRKKYCDDYKYFQHINTNLTVYR